MSITSYCKKNGGTGTPTCPVLLDLAVRVSRHTRCSKETLYQISRGHKRPSGRLARAIDEETNGEASRYELCESTFGKAPVSPPSEGGGV